MRIKPFLVALLAGLAASGAASAFDQQAVGPGTLPPIAPTYRADIVAWSHRYFPNAAAVGPVSISDPGLYRDGTGRLLWLVCLDVANPPNPQVTGSPERLAFGFAPGFFSAPQERYQSDLGPGDCTSPTLAFRPFREFPPGSPSRPVRRRTHAVR